MTAARLGSIPADHPSPHSTVAVQPACTWLTVVRFHLRAPVWRITAWSPRPALTRLVGEFDSLVRCQSRVAQGASEPLTLARWDRYLHPLPIRPILPMVRKPASHVGNGGFDSPMGYQLRAYPNRQRNNVESVASVRSNRTARTMGR